MKFVKQKKSTKKTIQTRKKCIVTKSTFKNNNNNNRNNIREDNIETTNFKWYQKCL